MTEFEIFENLTKIEIFLKIWPKTKFFQKFDQNQIFFCNFDQFRNFSKILKILTKIDFFL